MSDYFKKLEGFFAKAEEEVAQQQSERSQREQERQQWANARRLNNVPKDWRLLTDDEQGVQSYGDSCGIVHYLKDGIEMTQTQYQHEMDRRYGRGW